MSDYLLGITLSNDNKKKPVFLNDSTILYLSDKNRGVGFYTLRIINRFDYMRQHPEMKNEK